MAEDLNELARNLALTLRAATADTEVEGNGDYAAYVTAVNRRLNALDQVLYARWEAVFNAGSYTEAEAVNKLRGYITALQIHLNRGLIAALDEDLESAVEEIGAINEGLQAVKDATADGARDYEQVAGVLDQLAKLLGWLKDA
jgi:hypothetical protein